MASGFFYISRMVVLEIFATNYLFAASDYYRYVQKEDWNDATSDITAFIEQGDLILFNSNFVEIPFDYYLNTYSQDSSQVQKCIQAEKLGVPEDLFDNGILEPKMTISDEPGLISLLHGHKRVWLLYSHNSYTDPTGLIPQRLASQMKLIRQDDFYGVQVQLYGTP